MSNLLMRTLTAIILIIVSLWITWIGGVVFAIFSWGIGAAVLFEWLGITKDKWLTWQKIIAILLYIILGVMLVLNRSAQEIISFTVLSSIVLALFNIKNAGWLAGGFLYSALPAIALAFLRGHEPFGFGAIIFLFAVVWGTDIAAYFNGRALGGPKLAPKFSPNKTWSGAVGGAVIGVAAGTLIAYIALDTSPANYYIPILALLMSIVSQIGDIAESWIKRQFSIKDSGKLLPGHGGFMDRVDGLVVAALLLYIIGACVAGLNVPANLFNLI